MRAVRAVEGRGPALFVLLSVPCATERIVERGRTRVMKDKRRLVNGSMLSRITIWIFVSDSPCSSPGTGVEHGRALLL